jgi:hypothetical protein
MLWLHTSLVGSFFFIFHLMVIVMQSVMVEKVFYGVPHKLGWFEHSHVGMFQKKGDAAVQAHDNKAKDQEGDSKAVEMTVKSPGEDAPKNEEVEEVE